jgi:hypothetical protein
MRLRAVTRACSGAASALASLALPPSLGRQNPPLPIVLGGAPAETKLRDAVDVSVLSRGDGQEPAPLRTDEAHEALVESLQRDYVQSRTLSPPAGSITWPASLLRRWYADGTLSIDALGMEPPSMLTRNLIDRVGEGFPISELLPITPSLPANDGGSGSLLDGLRSSDPVGSLAPIVERLEEFDCVACKLGLLGGGTADGAGGVGVGGALLADMLAEAKRATPLMRPGELRAPDGGTVAGRSPSGEPRGDVHITARALPQWDGSWRALGIADAAVGALGSTLASALATSSPPRLGFRLARRSDAYLACFPGDGLGYGAHFDGDAHCRLTMILYTSNDWRAEHGGRLLLLDEARRTWWALPPRADMLVIFRSDRVLHRVEPCHGGVPRFALTVFFSESDADAQAERARAMLVANLTSAI